MRLIHCFCMAMIIAVMTIAGCGERDAAPHYESAHDGIEADHLHETADTEDDDADVDHDHDADADADHDAEDADHDSESGALIQVDTDWEQLIGLETAEAYVRPLQVRLSVPGIIIPRPDAHATVVHS